VFFLFPMSATTVIANVLDDVYGFMMTTTTMVAMHWKSLVVSVTIQSPPYSILDQKSRHVTAVEPIHW